MYFVLAYHRSRMELVERHEFPSEEMQQALTIRHQLTALFWENPQVEVVLLGSESEAELRKTHGRYFEKVAPFLSGDEPA